MFIIDHNNLITMITVTKVVFDWPVIALTVVCIILAVCNASNEKAAASQ